MLERACVDFEAALVEMDGEDDHVHLLVEYPPKISVSGLVNSLEKGLQSDAAQGTARHRQLVLEKCSLDAFVLRGIVRRRTD